MEGGVASQPIESSALYNEGLQKVKAAIFDMACRKNFLRLFTVCAEQNYPIDDEVLVSFILSHIRVYSSEHFLFAIKSLRALLREEKDKEVHHSMTRALHLTKYLYISLKLRDMNPYDVRMRDSICQEVVHQFPYEGQNPRNREKRRVIRRHFLTLLCDIEGVRRFQENFSRKSRIDRVYANFAVLATGIWKVCRDRNPVKMPLPHEFPSEPSWVLLQDHLRGNTEPDEETLLKFTECLQLSPSLYLSSALNSYENSYGSRFQS
ncbi:hypothetical protein QR680_009216 [Steinernema hermaphroditum]|uniref:Uncharacterized protein n=1 Tax=Steinernema hermaphroditum TaxID=289476 RepID=A0AA39M9H9_9BILA|nr:hypothetical protein QR680_009216 [Steinernema hermaphroditum]